MFSMRINIIHERIKAIETLPISPAKVLAFFLALKKVKTKTPRKTIPTRLSGKKGSQPEGISAPKNGLNKADALLIKLIDPKEMSA